MGRSKMELGGCILPMGLSATHVDKVSLRSRLNMNKGVYKLIRELEVMGKVLVHIPLFSTQDGVSRVSNGFNINDLRGDG